MDMLLTRLRYTGNYSIYLYNAHCTKEVWLPGLMDVALPEVEGDDTDTKRSKDEVFLLERRITQQEALVNIMWQREKQLGKEVMVNSCRSEDGHLRNRRSYEVLCKHVDTLAAALRGLNQEVQYLQGQVRLGDHQLELHDKAVRGLGQFCTHDVRGQIGRCDHALMTLMYELRACQKDIKELEKEHKKKEKLLSERIQTLEVKNGELQALLKQETLNSQSQYKQLQSWLSQEVATMETRLKGQISETTTKSLENHQQIENNVTRQQNLLSTKVDIFQAQRDAKHREMESLLHAEFKKLEQVVENEKRRHNQFEERVKRELKQQCYQQLEQLDRIHHKHQEALVGVHENIRVMKSLIDDKISILESRLRKLLHQPHTQTVLLK